MQAAQHPHGLHHSKSVSSDSRCACRQSSLRKMVIDLVLATDMQKHVSVHTALQTKLAVMQAAERAPNELKRSFTNLDRSFKDRRTRMNPAGEKNEAAGEHAPNQNNDADHLLLLQVRCAAACHA